MASTSSDSWPRRGSRPAWRARRSPARAHSGSRSCCWRRFCSCCAAATSGASPGRSPWPVRRGRGLVGARHGNTRRRSAASAHRARGAGATRDRGPAPARPLRQLRDRAARRPSDRAALGRDAAAGRDRGGQRAPRAGAAVPPAASTPHLARTPGRPRDPRPSARWPCSAAAEASRACSTASATARGPRSRRAATTNRVGSQPASRSAGPRRSTTDCRGVPGLRARAPAGRLGRQRRPPGRRGARPGLARRVPRAAGARLRDPGGDRVRRDRGRRAVGRACRSDGRAGVAGLAGRLRARPLASARPRGGGGARARSVGDRGPGFQLSSSRRRHPRSRAAHPLDGSRGRSYPCGCAPRSRSRWPARSRPHRWPWCISGRASLVASLPANLLALPAVAPLLWLALAACASGPSRPGRQRCSTARCERSAPTSGWSRASAPGSTARCPGAALLVAIAGGGARAGSPGAGPPARSRARSQGCGRARRGPPRASPPPARAAGDVPRRRAGRAALIEAPGTASARRHRPARRARRADTAAARRGLAGRAAAVARRARPRRPRGARSCARCSVAAARHTGAPRPRARASRGRVTAARERGTRVLRGRAGLVLRSGAVELRVVGPLVRHARRRRRTTRALVVLARQGTCSFLLPADAESPVLLARRPPTRRACWRSRITAPATPLSRATARAAAAAARGHLGGRAQHLRPSRAGDARGARRGRCAGAPHRSRRRRSRSAAERAGDADRITAMSAAPLDPVYLIGGTDRPKVELAVRRLRARVRAEDGSVEEFTARRADDDGEGMSGEEAAGACNALGLFGGTRSAGRPGRRGVGRREEGGRRPRCARRVPRRAGARRRARAADAGRGAGRAPALAGRSSGQRPGLRPARSRGATRVAAQAGLARRCRPRRQRAHAPARARRRRRPGARERGREARPVVAGRDDHGRARRRAVRAHRRHAALGPDRCARRSPTRGCAASARPPARRPRRRRAALGAHPSRATCASWRSRST